MNERQAEHPEVNPNPQSKLEIRSFIPVHGDRSY